MPPYFAALVFSLIWTLLYEGVRYRSGHANSLALEFSPGNLISHLLLVFNLFPRYWAATNGAFWSVATEWQIYFVFAFLLLPVWRRVGNMATLAVAFALGVGPHYLLPPGAALSALNGACSWFIGLFAIGMVGAVVGTGRPSAAPGWERRIPWGTLCALLILALVFLTATYSPPDDPWGADLIRHYTWITDTLCGLATICLILFCARPTRWVDSAQSDVPARYQKSDMRGVIQGLLEARFAMALGAFSYSLYLVHVPILSALLYVAVHSPLSPLLRVLFMWSVGLFLSLGLAFLFSRVFERPFVSSGGPPLRSR